MIPDCDPLQKDVKDVFAAISFEVAYSLGKHVLEGASGGHLPALAPVLRWKKGGKIAAKNEVRWPSCVGNALQ